MKYTPDQIQNAGQQAINWNQSEHQREIDMRLQGLDYRAQYKSYQDFLPVE